ncbi:MAG: nucleoside triphosphate pyrophosphohydrolase [Chloroflexi bacterium]|nr:nucleoside triphosphate pyrophosphohydrolase [Chloroflexota bacterium]
MAEITVVGLGPGESKYLTLEAWQVLESTSEVWLRTQRHPTVAQLPSHLVLHSFDTLYDGAGDFGEVYDAIVAEIVRLSQRPGGVVYAVPGHPMVGEATVQRILSEAKRRQLRVRIVEGLSFVEPVLTALGLDALSGLQVVDAIEVATRFHPPLNPDMPALIGQLHSRSLAADVKLTLMNQYGDEFDVVLVHAAGTEEQRVDWMPLYEIDHDERIAHLTSLFVPALQIPGSFETLQDTVAHLRAPSGCPWDREQTHESLRASLLEETYETLAAIDSGDVVDLQEELGDLLLQIVLHAQIATEDDDFHMDEVIAGIDSKLKHRHPHVWGDRPVADTGEVLQRWEQLKREEKGSDRSVLDGVPMTLPALQQAHSYGQRAARVGFDWPDPSGVIAKIEEEIAELQAALTEEDRVAELGDVLFAVVNWARWLEIDPEVALREANARFRKRFQRMETTARERSIDLATLDIAQLEGLWQKAKRAS